MRIQEGHHHAFTEYDFVGWKHYIKLLWSVLDCKIRRGKSLTAHLPFEMQHQVFKSTDDDFSAGTRFVEFGERLKRVFRIKLYWENAPWLRKGTWDLKVGNTYWHAIPTDIDLCLDTGHLMLGLKEGEFVSRLKFIMQQRGEQIKHLHLSENDLVHDQHKHTHKILTPDLVKKITKERTFIWEKS